MDKNKIKRKGPLYGAFENLQKKNKLSLSMPGHKGEGPEDLKKIFGKSLKLDVTELLELDDLHEPAGVLLESEEFLSKAFFADKTRFLVNGASGGLKASLLMASGDKVLCPRNSHRSILDGLILADKEPVYLMPEKSSLPFLLPPSADEYRKHQHLAETAVVLTASYEGINRNYEGLKKNLETIIADEAHGTHFPFMQGLKSAISYADIVVHGAHKTFGSLTQSGFIHCKEGMLEELRKNLRLMESTSPSWLFLLSLEIAAAWWTENIQEAVRRCQEIDVLKKKINNIRGLNTLQGYDIPEDVSLDPFKIYISIGGPLNGYQMREILCDVYGIEMEAAGVRNILGILSPFDPPESDRRLLEALESISKEYGLKETFAEDIQLPERFPTMVLKPREAFLAKKRKIKLQEAYGKIAGDIVAAYPPGIPILCPGERIDKETIEVVLQLKSLGARFQGMQNEEIEIIGV